MLPYMREARERRCVESICAAWPTPIADFYDAVGRRLHSDMIGRFSVLAVRDATLRVRSPFAAADAALAATSRVVSAILPDDPAAGGDEG